MRVVPIDKKCVKYLYPGDYFSSWSTEDRGFLDGWILLRYFNVQEEEKILEEKNLDINAGWKKFSNFKKTNLENSKEIYCDPEHKETAENIKIINIFFYWKHWNTSPISHILIFWTATFQQFNTRAYVGTVVCLALTYASPLTMFLIPPVQK